jgi:hypothetical protein
MIGLAGAAVFSVLYTTSIAIRNRAQQMQQDSAAISLIQPQAFYHSKNNLL